MRDDIFKNMSQEDINDLVKSIKESIMKGAGISVPTVSVEENLEHHEERLRVNMMYDNFHSAEFHLKRIIYLRIELILKRHCGYESK